MFITFETPYGKIECARESDGLGHAYFFRDDMGADIDVSGSFKHPFTGTEFIVHWGRTDGQGRAIPATLDVWRPVQIASL